MRLSRKIDKFRADRPDEWTMDEFKRHAQQLETALQNSLLLGDHLYFLVRQGCQDKLDINPDEIGWGKTTFEYNKLLDDEK